jgi:lipoprotein-releasing system ATP-binding protein
MKISFEKVSRTYRDANRELVVLDSVSCEFPEKGSVAIVGRSGIGKSTMLNLLGGLDRPSEGQVRYGDVAINELGDERLSEFRGENIGFIFQFHHLLPEFTAVENVAMPLLIQGEAAERASEKAAAVLERVGLRERLEHRPSELSGGEQQRVAIARALVGEPAVVLADEPTGNLDLETAAQVRSLLLECQRDLANVLVVVTHSRELAGAMDTVLEMQPGGALCQVSSS